MSKSREIYSVSLLNMEAQRILEDGLATVWLEGEISNFSRPASGHWYFTLKDAKAQVAAAMFRGRNLQCSFLPENGRQVLVRARVTLYTPRGTFQLVVDHMEHAGEGALRQQLEILRARLAAEGLFAADRKRPVPLLPRQIGIITSPAGAAIRDVLKVLQRRCPGIPVLVYPSPVQGREAPAQLVAALARANARKECDVLLLTRGGGSLEDLWAFNDEKLARAVAASDIPIVSAVGHEMDVSLTDLVADLRAATPSAAAELLSPDQHQMQRRCRELENRLALGINRTLATRQDMLLRLRKRMQRPDQRLVQFAQQIDDLENRLAREIRHHIRSVSQRSAQLQRRVHAQAPLGRLASSQHELQIGYQRMALRLRDGLADRRKLCGQLQQRLHTASPLATLDRGYSITLHNNRATKSVAEIRPGDSIRVRMHDGSLLASVSQVALLSEEEGSSD